MAPIRHPDRLLAAWANDLQRPGETRRNTERGAMSLTRWHDAAQIRLGDGSRERKRPVAHAQMQLPALIFPNSHHHNRCTAEDIEKDGVAAHYTNFLNMAYVTAQPGNTII
uniref:Uncharacterized protein n=1 Tax=Oryza nivara TaxID=4536 RepID=A0A0E0HLM9_ORYNI